ncbi:hypothetical protein D3C81_1903800 [compost metagenome]
MFPDSRWVIQEVGNVIPVCFSGDVDQTLRVGDELYDAGVKIAVSNNPVVTLFYVE